MVLLCLVSSLHGEVLLPNLTTHLVCRYDFDHPVATNSAREQDLGSSGTAIFLVNGGAAMRVNDGAYPDSTLSLQTQQFNPTTAGNDDWKAGIYLTNGLASLGAFSSITGITLMGWVKPTGTNPNLNSITPATTDYYNAIGLFGLLSGTSEGHGVRALLEVIDVSGTLRLVALGRRVDSGSSYTLAATNDWHTLLPDNVWTHLAATFDFDNGTLALYRNGVALTATYTTGGDPWAIVGGAEPDLTSAANSAGIKIGGSYPQNTREQNAFNGRFDDLMFFNKVLSPAEVQQQHASFLVAGAPPLLAVVLNGHQLTLSWPTQHMGYTLESITHLASSGWISNGIPAVTNGGNFSVTQPVLGTPQFFRLKKP